MKKQIFIIALFSIALLTVNAQKNTQPKWIVEKCSQMADQAKTDLNLSDDEALKYKEIIIEKFSTDAAATKTMESSEAKIEYRKESGKKFSENLISVFGKEKGKAIQKWTADNQAKFKKAKN